MLLFPALVKHWINTWGRITSPTIHQRHWKLFLLLSNWALPNPHTLWEDGFWHGNFHQPCTDWWAESGRQHLLWPWTRRPGSLPQFGNHRQKPRSYCFDLETIFLFCAHGTFRDDAGWFERIKWHTRVALHTPALHTQVVCLNWLCNFTTTENGGSGPSPLQMMGGLCCFSDESGKLRKWLLCSCT